MRGLAVLAMLAGGAVALSGNALAHGARLAVQPIAGPHHSRILTGTSAEGAAVDATMTKGVPSRIVAEVLGENNRVISDFVFDHGRLATAHVVRLGYKGYPATDLSQVPPHAPLTIEPSDTVLSDATYRYAGGADGCTGADCAGQAAGGKAAAAAAAADYVRLIRTPSPGMAEDEGSWSCTEPGSAACPAYRHDAAG